MTFYSKETLREFGYQSVEEFVEEFISKHNTCVVSYRPGGVVKAQNEYHAGVLTAMGYARPLAEYICNHTDGSGYSLAVALDSQPGINMDTKIAAIFSHI